MTRRTFAIAAALLAALPLAAAEPDKPAEPSLSGPYTHNNLSVFLLNGKDTIQAGAKLLTLQEALEQKKLIVHETSNVNELSVENVSDDVDVFIQSGDIVKGGRQDRLMACDMLVPPKSGKLPIGSFCCESGRWRQRGAESAAQFGASNAQAANKAVKLAVNAAGDQGQVWQKVKEAQDKLAKNVGKSVANSESPSSYQLTLEDKDLLAKVAAYVDALKKVPGEKADAIGFVIVINGKVEGAELYGSHALFLKLWPKLINGAAVDALTELDGKKKFDAPTVAVVEKFLAEAAKGKEKEVLAARDLGRGQPAARGGRASNDAPVQQQGGSEGRPAAEQPVANAPPTRAKVTSVDNDKSIMLEAKDRQDGKLLHRSYIAK
jgi:hypothetical protein